MKRKPFLLRICTVSLFALCGACDQPRQESVKEPVNEADSSVLLRKKLVGTWACKLVDDQVMIVRIHDDGTYKIDEIYLSRIWKDDDGIPVEKTGREFGESREGQINLETGEIIPDDQEKQFRKQSGFVYEGVAIRADGALEWIRDHGNMGTENITYHRIDKL